MAKKKTSKDTIARQIADVITSNFSEKISSGSSSSNFAGSMTSSVGGMIQGLQTDEDKTLVSDGQRKIFQDMLATLKKIAANPEGASGKEREQIRMYLAKLVVKTEKQIEKLEKEVTEKQEQITNNKEITKEEKEKLEKQIEKLEQEKEKQTGVAEEAKTQGKAINTEERLTLGQAIRADTTNKLRNLAPGLDFKQQEGEGFMDMIKREGKSMLSPSGFHKAFGTIKVSEKPSFDEVLNTERTYDDLSGKLGSVKKSKKLSEDLQESTPQEGSNTEQLLTDLLQEVAVIRKVVEGRMSYNPNTKAYSDIESGKMLKKDEVRAAGTGLYSKDELNEKVGLSKSQLKKTSLSELEKMARTVQGKIEPSQMLQNLKQDGAITNVSGSVEDKMLDALTLINNSIKQGNEVEKEGVDLQEEKYRQDELNKDTILNSELASNVEGQLETKASNVQTLAANEENTDGGSSGRSISDKIKQKVMDQVSRRLGGRVTRQAASGAGRTILSRGGNVLRGGGTALLQGGRAAMSGVSGLASGAAGATLSTGLLAAGGLAAGLYAGDKMFNTSVEDGGSGTLSDFMKYNVNAKENEQAADVERRASADAMAKSKGFTNFADMQESNKRKRAQIQASPNRTGSKVTTATEKADILNMSKESGGTTIINNNNTSSDNSSGTSSMINYNVRPIDNSFTRFQDKRVTRI